MARGVHQMPPVEDDLNSLSHQTIDDPVHCFLIAWNGARGENHAIPARERNIGVLVLRDARKCCPWLALAASTKRKHLVRRQVPVNIDRAKLLVAVEITGLTRNPDDRIHRSPHDTDFALAQLRGFDYGAQASNI